MDMMICQLSFMQRMINILKKINHKKNAKNAHTIRPQVRLQRNKISYKFITKVTSCFGPRDLKIKNDLPTLSTYFKS